MIKDIARRILLRMLIWTEKKTGPAVRHKFPVWSREVHFSPLLTICIVTVLIFSMLIIEIEPTIPAMLGLVLFFAVVLAAFIVYVKKESPELAKDNDAMMLLGLIAILSVMAIEVVKSLPSVSSFLVPISAMTVLTLMLLNRHIAVILAVSMSFICVMVNGFRFEYMLFHLLGSVVGVHTGERIKNRQNILYVGLEIMLANIVSVVILTLSGYLKFGSLHENVMWSGANGLLLIMILLILLSPLEMFFSRITSIKLIELADFNQPLLKRLVMEAPGTYHHSLTVASIAEQAGEAVDANTLLLRVGAYYHDIGKLVKPGYFIENQIASDNPHDAIAPSMSGIVIISHIKEGVNLAKKKNMDRPIIDLIEQHHGDSLMYTLYQKALEKNNEVPESDFRYPGPKPKTRESAILMLADSCEAASRTLDEPTPGKLKNLVERIINNKFTDGQLADSPLTLSDLNKIAQSIVETLSGIYHARIEYEASEKPAQPKDQKTKEQKQ